MTTQDIVQHRLANQRISTTSRSPAEVVAHLGAMQAQDYEGALWAVGLRTPDSTRTDVERAIVDREIIRTWPMRGTLHFVAATDVRWMLELMTPRVISGAASRVRNLELNDEIFARSQEIFQNALSGGKVLTRDAMCQLLEAAGISTKGQRGIHIMWRLSQEGLLCYGPHEGKQPTFTLLSEWAPGAKSLPRDEAVATIVERYFISHGPATSKDFMRWSGLTAGDTKAGLEAVKHRLISETIDGQVYWLSRNSAELPSVDGSAYLLPGFDEYMLGYGDRSAALATHHNQKIVPGNNGMFLATIVLDGQVSGLWTKKLRTKSVVITPKPFEKISASQYKALRKTADRYGAFLGLSCEVI